MIAWVAAVVLWFALVGTEVCRAVETLTHDPDAMAHARTRESLNRQPPEAR